MMMMFQQNLLQFSSLSLVYRSYEQVAILGAMEGLFFDSGRLLWMMMFQQNLLQSSSLSLVYGSYEQVAILGAMDEITLFLCR